MTYTVKELSKETFKWEIAMNYATRQLMENVTKSEAFRFVKHHNGAFMIENENGVAVHYGH